MKKTNELSSRQMKEVKGGRRVELGPGDARFHVDEPEGPGGSGSGYYAGQPPTICYEVIFNKVVGHPEMRCGDHLICRQLWGPDAYCSDGLRD